VGRASGLDAARAALLSIHARVKGAHPASWEHSSLVQIWGPRFSNYVIAAEDLSIFPLGRLPDDERRRRRAHDTAWRLRAFLMGRHMACEATGHAMGVNPNSLRYAAPTGTVVMRWDGARVSRFYRTFLRPRWIRLKTALNLRAGSSTCSARYYSC